MTELSKEDKEEIKASLEHHIDRCDNLYYELRNKLAEEFKVNEDDIEEIWEEVI